MQTCLTPHSALKKKNSEAKPGISDNAAGDLVIKGFHPVLKVTTKVKLFNNFKKKIPLKGVKNVFKVKEVNDAWKVFFILVYQIILLTSLTFSPT